MVGETSWRSGVQAKTQKAMGRLHPFVGMNEDSHISFFTLAAFGARGGTQADCPMACGSVIERINFTSYIGRWIRTGPPGKSQEPHLSLRKMAQIRAWTLKFLLSPDLI